MEHVIILSAITILLLAWLIYGFFFKKRTDYSNVQDVLAETDVYIAYGINKSAQDLLEKALKHNPGNAELLTKLNEVRSKNT